MAQLLSVGVKGGLPVTYSAANDQQSATIFTGPAERKYIVGPMVEVHLPFHLSIEGDALYHPYSLRTTITTSAGTAISEQTHSVWEFPIVGKLRLARGFARPYVEAGPSFRTSPGGLTSLVNGGSLSKAGLTVGGGIEFKLLFLKISPEFRYTRWAKGDLGNTVDSPNQAALLLGIAF